MSVKRFIGVYVALPFLISAATVAGSMVGIGLVETFQDRKAKNKTY